MTCGVQQIGTDFSRRSDDGFSSRSLYRISNLKDYERTLMSAARITTVHKLRISLLRSEGDCDCARWCAWIVRGRKAWEPGRWGPAVVLRKAGIVAAV